jgi:hypothetical protein
MSQIEKFLKKKTKNILGLKETASLIIFFALLFSIIILDDSVFGAAGNYSISGSYTVTGFTVTLSGTASGNPYVGKCSDQHLSIDWDIDGNHTFDQDQDVPADTFNKVCSGGKGEDHNNGSFINASWSALYTYTQPGSYTILVKVYHGNSPGAEGSDAATYKINITVPGCTTNADCDDGSYCNGQETCVSGSCVPGTPVNCSLYNILGIATCDNNPDNNSFTWDWRAAFTS